MISVLRANLPSTNVFRSVSIVLPSGAAGDTGQCAFRAKRRRILGLIAIAAPGWSFTRSVIANTAAYPTRALRFVVPNGAGGSSDLLVRLVSARLGDALGQPVIVDLRPGAAGKVAMDHVARSPPDGYTLFLANNGTAAILPAVDGAGAPDQASFAPVSRLTSLPIVIAATPSLGVATLPGLIERAKSAPGLLPYASGGIGSTSHLSAALLSRRAGVKFIQVPYSATAFAVKDVLAGEVPLIFTHLGTVAPYLRVGQLRALAVTGKRRAAAFPDIPTVAEAGFPGFDVTTWHGVLVPMGTSDEIVGRLHGELARIITNEEVRERLENMGMEVVGNTPAQFAADIRADREHWAMVIRDAGLPTQ
jgi:tripartite-type tricarboxylate transporter receptor subunit TctC